MRRAGSGYADGRLGLPAGHVDLGETPTASAVREIAEATGITVYPAQLRPAGTMFRRSLEPRVDIFFTASTWTGNPEIREPHKCTELVWADRTTCPPTPWTSSPKPGPTPRTGRSCASTASPVRMAAPRAQAPQGVPGWMSWPVS